jgi:4-diphosphocytidyl-2-C-methyl-D-erythritol kinase
MSAAVVVKASAKLTLSLRVTGVRDDGYHLIDAEMVSLDLVDELTIVPGGHGVSLSSLGVITELDVDPRDNLVSRALALADRQAQVIIEKRIPAGAGLGGGSADAAAVLRWAGHEDLVSAAGIGADVAFCLHGGRARVRGIGEVVEPLQYVHRTFTVVTPPIHCSTPEVYRRWDELGGPSGEGPNDLEPAALSLVPELAAVRDRLEEETGVTPMLAGSGSSWFVEGAFPEAGVVVATVPAVS